MWKSNFKNNYCNDSHSYNVSDWHAFNFSSLFKASWYFGQDNSDDDSLVLTGTAGGSTKLTTDNATLSLIGDGSVTLDGVTLTHTTTWYGYSSTKVQVAEWNQSGFKELKIINSDDQIIVDDIVDVNIVNDNCRGVDIDLNNVKRGVIETGSGSDSIDISIYSNLANWTNYFSISTGGGDDDLVMYDVQKSYLTSFDIDMGSGDDIVDISGMLDASTDSITRNIDGGEGIDTLIFNGEDVIDFQNFELILASDDDVSITLCSDVLASNGFDSQLVISGLDIVLDEDVSISSVEGINWSDYFYLSSLDQNARDFLSVTIEDSDGNTYDILTDDFGGLAA